MQNLMIVGNFSSDTGYAWKTISEYFVSLSEMFQKMGNKSYISYPVVTRIPESFQSAGLKVVEFDFSSKNLIGLIRFLRKYKIGIMYLTDRPVFSFKYFFYRLAGVRKIVVHDRTSGDRKAPRGFKKWAKTIINRRPMFSADLAIAISDFVKGRLNRVSCFPERRLIRIWNGIDIEKFAPGLDRFVYEFYGIPEDKRIIFSYSRANKYKGVQVLIEAADILINERGREDLFFLFCGDGPDLDFFRSDIRDKNLTDSFLCPGNSDRVDRILRGVSVVVVPSLWQEGFGLSVAEGMATGKVVIASAVGGIPEIITDSVNGYLMNPGNAEELAFKIMQVVDEEGTQRKVGLAARKTIIEDFNIEKKKIELQEVFRGLL